MNKPYLEVTYRQGKPFAAYLYLDRRPGDIASRSERRDGFVIDYAADNRTIGIELTTVSTIDFEMLGRLIEETTGEPLDPADMAPFKAA